MKVIIDIPKEMYEDCKARNTGHYSLYDFSSMITNGTPLSKGHGRLIDADALEISEDYDGIDAMNVIYSAPTIIEADRKEQE